MDIIFYIIPMIPQCHVMIPYKYYEHKKVLKCPRKDLIYHLDIF